MNWFEALVLGLVQGLTEYLPVSSSGHLAIGAYLFGINGEDNLTFTIMVHVATVLSTLVILWKEIDWILKGLFKFQMNEETKYALNIVISMIPVGIVGVFFKDKVEEVFGSGLLIVGCIILILKWLFIIIKLQVSIISKIAENTRSRKVKFDRSLTILYNVG